MYALPEFKSAASSQEDNPFACPGSQSTSKISVNRQQMTRSARSCKNLT